MWKITVNNELKTITQNYTKKFKTENVKEVLHLATFRASCLD